MTFQKDYQVAACAPVAREAFELTIECSEMAASAVPGQFVHIAADHQYLRRPISICSADKNAGTLTVVFGVRGEGTAKLSRLKKGDRVNVLGPLGHGFTFPEKQQNQEVLLVGGGIGVPPMVFAAEGFEGVKAAVIGFGTKEQVMLTDSLKQAGCEVIVTTEDGSLGEQGFVTAPAERLLQTGRFHQVLACGPVMMLKSVAALCERYGIPCQVSLEERMACGLGACLVCACKTLDAQGNVVYGHVCKDGPVFDAKAVVFP